MPMDRFQTIHFTVDGGVGRLTLNRPERLNAFTAEMHAELREVLSTLAADECLRALVITGAGRAFCAGQDLAERRVPVGAPPVDLGASIERNYAPLVLSLRALPLPVIAAVNGLASGAGISLALACDLVVAARSARFVAGFNRVGVIPDAGCTWFLPRAVGPAQAMALALLGEDMDAEAAQRSGLVWRCVADEALAATVDEVVARLLRSSRVALAAAKQALQESSSHTLEQQMRLERDLMRGLGRADDYREGVTAFFERREPQFNRAGS